ncbi:hypothetical protein [Blattabacterium cuenoti]|uniref:hypothetical protein n=1 Tax=Blattabacterium cuenoti TaxID=1653831 RepID=UPI00163D3D3B|nr:hypothetical protein [Blattabacterium cuenoti]
MKKEYREKLETSGKYFVTDGLFHFSKKKEIIPLIRLDKRFKIKQGSFITWENNFDKSDINLTAYTNKYISTINFSKYSKIYKYK